MIPLAARRSAATAAIAEGFFGAAWFSWGEADAGAPRWLVDLDVVGFVLGLLLGLAAVVEAVRLGARRPPEDAAPPDGGPDGLDVPTTGPGGDDDVRGRWARIVTLEVVVIVIGIVVLRLAGVADYLPVWFAAAVGLHFLPLADLYGVPQLRTLGVSVTAVAVVALAVGLTSDVAPSTVAGPLVGGCLLVAGLGAYRHARA